MNERDERGAKWVSEQARFQREARLRSATSLTVLLAVAGADAQWTTRAHMPYPAGQAAIVTGQDGRFYLFGGWSTNPGQINKTNKLLIYDPQSDTWSQGATLPVYSIGDAAVQTPDGRIHLLNCYFEKVAVYNPDRNVWEGSHAASWVRYSARAVRTADDRYFIFGGERCDHTTYEYFPSSFSVQPRAPVPDVPDPEYNSFQYPGVYVCEDGTIYVIGGLPHLYKVHGPMDQVVQYDPVDDSWTTGHAPMPTARFSFGYVRGWNRFLYALGGSSDYTMQYPPRFDAVEIYDPDTDTWRTGPRLPVGLRECAAGIDDRGVIYVFGGSADPDGSYVNTVYAYDTRVGHQGPVPADFDRDGDVDQDDLDHFESCASAPGVFHGNGCADMDFDGDRDVDQADFGVLQRCYSGENVRADLTCAD